MRCMVCNMPDFEDGLTEDEEDEEDEDEKEIDGVQARMIVHNDNPATFHATIHYINDEGEDTHPPAYTVTSADVGPLDEDGIELDNAEGIIDFFRDIDGLPYCDWYLDSDDDVIWVTLI